MQRKECSDCGCLKSEHKRNLCFSCFEIYHDNYKEYMEGFAESSKKFVSPWHEFKLDNLRYLEQCYESKAK